MRERCGSLFSRSAYDNFRSQPPLAESKLAEVEQAMGFALPTMLRLVYQQVGNGGFGPGYGLFGLDRATGDVSDCAVELYALLSRGDPDDSEFSWPPGMLPICDWGCVIRSHVDCTHPEAPVYRSDDEYDLTLENASFQAWLEEWLSGSMQL